jgi:hypothetical protein
VQEVERPVQAEEQSLTRSKRASAQNVSNVIRLVKSASQQMMTYDHSSLPASPRADRQLTPPSPEQIPSQGGSPRSGTAGPSNLQLYQFSMSPQPVVESFPSAAVKLEATPLARSSTPQAGDSPHQSHTLGSRYTTPEHRSYSPAIDHAVVEPGRDDSGAISLATTTVVGPSHLQQPGHPAGAAAAAEAEPGSYAAPLHAPVGDVSEEKPPIIGLPLPLPAHPLPPQSGHHQMAVGIPAPVPTPSHIASTPEPAPPTPATAGGTTSNYPGHEGVAVNDPRVYVNEWRSEEGVLGLLFTGSEKEYSDAYWFAPLAVVI